MMDRARKRNLKASMLERWFRPRKRNGIRVGLCCRTIQDLGRDYQYLFEAHWSFFFFFFFFFFIIFYSP